MDVLFLGFLILLNGVFAMSEMALAASRKARLQALAETGDAGASAAMDLHDNPTQFLSTVQIGITSIGILNGIVGEAAFSAPLADWLEAQFDVPQRIADIGALAGVVVIITYLTIVLGELLPKRLALLAPERLAAHIALPMHWLSKAATPMVWLLSASVRGLLSLLRLKDSQAAEVTEEEIRILAGLLP